MFALVDCNNFYASCEKLFRPDLKHTPVVVLSNNDGCIVARSKEAKALGIKMGLPYFKMAPELRRLGVKVFSSNYALYGDISDRVMQTLESMVPSVEIYSIDEAFLDLSGFDSAMPLFDLGNAVRERVAQDVGIQVCVGIAPTKTLAKLANHAAKKYPATGGVVDLRDPERQKRLLKLVPVEDVWGVGRKLSARLNAMGVETALDLANQNPKHIRQRFSVVLERTVNELNGIACLDLETLTPPRKQIVCSRSFGEKIRDHQSMREAVSSYVVRGAEKLRGERQTARLLTVFLRTSQFLEHEPQYRASKSHTFSVPTSDTRELLNVSSQLLRVVWRDGYRFAKAGILLSDFYPEGTFQPELFDTPTKPSDPRLMSVVDTVNRHNRGGVFFASQGIARTWSLKRDYLSPMYTTGWRDIPVVT